MAGPYCVGDNPVYPPGEDYGNPKAWAGMMEWQFIWLKTVARVWEESGKPNSEKQFSNDLFAATDLSAFYKKWFDYDLNPHLKLTVQMSTREYDPCAPLSFFKNHNRFEDKPLHLLMFIPKPPADMGKAAYNLASYADSGRSYPFTCC